MLAAMTIGWNFERRRDTCTQFLIGVMAAVSGKANAETSLEAVRSRMRLSPEEARFAARRLAEEELLVFDGRGAIRSNARGITSAEERVRTVRAKVTRFEDVVRVLRVGGPPLAVFGAVIRVDGAPLACGAPDSEPEATYRLALAEDVVTLERSTDGASFEPVPLPP